MSFSPTHFECTECEQIRGVVDLGRGYSIYNEKDWKEDLETIVCMYCQDNTTGKYLEMERKWCAQGKHGASRTSFLWVGVELSDSCALHTFGCTHDIVGAERRWCALGKHPAPLDLFKHENVELNSCTAHARETNPFRFMDLAPELRNRIYEYTLPTNSRHTLIKQKLPGVTQVSEQVRHESLNIDLHSTDFSVTVRNTKDLAIVTKWLAGLPLKGVSNIRTLTLFCDDGTFHEDPLMMPYSRQLIRRFVYDILSAWKSFFDTLKFSFPELQASQLRWPGLLPSEQHPHSFAGGESVHNIQDRLYRRAIFQKAVVGVLAKDAGFVVKENEPRDVVQQVRETITDRVHVFDGFVTRLNQKYPGIGLGWLRAASKVSSGKVKTGGDLKA